MAGRRSTRSVTRPRATQAERARAVSLERRRLLVLWLMAASTLVWLPGGFTRFVFPKLLVVAVACAIAATLPRERRLPRSVSAAMLVGAVLVTLAGLLGQTPVASLIGRWPRYEGLPVLGLYAASVWLGPRAGGRGGLRAVHLAHAMSGMSLVLGAFSLADLLGHSPLGPSGTDRSGSLLGNATDQGLVAMMSVVVIVAVAAERADRFLYAGAVAAVATVAISGSRIALILTVLGVLGVVLVRVRARGRGPDRRVLLGAAGLVAAMVAVALVVPVTRDRLLDPATGSGRLLQWRLTLGLLGDHPWLGLGPSRYVDAFGTYETPAFVRFTGPATIADSPHDLLLQTTVGGGVPLLMCLVVLVVICWRRALRVVAAHPEAWGPALAAAAYGVAMLADFTVAGSTCLAAFLAGSVLGEPAITQVDGEPSRGTRWRARATAGGFVVAAGLMAMSCVSEVLLAHGVASAERGDVSTARADVDAAHRWRPLDGDVAMLGAQALAGAADAGSPAAGRDAVVVAGSALTRTPGSYAAQVAQAVGLIAEHRPAAARSILDQAVAAFPDRPDAYVQRAVARAETDDTVGARADLQVAAGIEPRSATVRRLLQRLGSGRSTR